MYLLREHHARSEVVLMATLGGGKYGLLRLKLPTDSFRQEVKEMISSLNQKDRFYDARTYPFPLHIPYKILEPDELESIELYCRLGPAGF